MTEDDDHERHAQEFIAEYKAILVDALKLSPEIAPSVFDRVSRLHGSLRLLFVENTRKAEERVLAKAREAVDKALRGYL